jgi:hypothetical protein
MDPSNNNQPGMQLPQPVADSVQASQPPMPSGQPMQAQPGTLVPPPMPAPPQPPAQAQANGNPAVADDGDLIEKEWVHKAKSIVESTKGDPYKQSEALTALKADYMQKRYNKTIKTTQ